MEGVSLVETKALNTLINRLESLENKVVEAVSKYNKPYLTTKDVCEMLNKSENWVLLHKHDLGSSKRTGTLLFKRKDVEEYIEEGYYKSNK
jgi:prophage antirepressor-like protein